MLPGSSPKRMQGGSSKPNDGFGVSELLSFVWEALWLITVERRGALLEEVLSLTAVGWQALSRWVAKSRDDVVQRMSGLSTLCWLWLSSANHVTRDTSLAKGNKACQSLP